MTSGEKAYHGHLVTPENRARFVRYIDSLIQDDPRKEECSIEEQRKLGGQAIESTNQTPREVASLDAKVTTDIEH